jgi:hypothetical protein
LNNLGDITMTYTNSNQIGEVTEIKGIAKIIRTDGSEESVTLGTEIFQGDIVETSGDGAVNIGFTDDSSFAVSDDARITIDEFVFDPETEGGAQDFSVARGVFMYTSGLIGRENPDSVEIDTPVGAIGIRGTIIGGDIQPDGESQITVIEGAIVVRNDAGEQLLTNQFDTVKLTTRDVPPSEVQQKTVNDIANDFGSIKDVSASLFSSFQDQMQQENNGSDPSANGNIPEEANASDDTDQNNEVDGEDSSDTEILDEAAISEEAEAEAAEETAEDQIEESQEQNEEVRETAEESVEQAQEASEAADDTTTLEEVAIDSTAETLKEATNKQQVQKIAENIRNNAEERSAERQEAQNKFLDNVREQLGLDPSDDPLAPEVINRLTPEQIEDKLALLEEYDLNENADGSTTPVLIGKIALESGEENVSYSISVFSNGVDVSTDFDVTPVLENGSMIGHIYFIGSDSGDFEAGDEYDITLTSTNNVTDEIITQTETLEVSDVNEQSFITGNTTPTALAENNSIAGGLASDVNVATLTFTELDSDASNQTTFTVDDSRFDVIFDTSSDQWQLIAKAGEVFDFELDGASINVTITADDGAFGTDDHVVTVAINDVIESPTDINYTGGSVFENDSNGTTAATLSTVDEDAGDTFTYSIENDPSGIFSIVGNEIRVGDNTNLDYESAEDHTLTIRTTDSNGNYHEEDITINVNDINEAPVIALNNPITIDEGDSSIVIDSTKLNATDGDASDTPENLTYTLDSPPSNGTLYLNGTALNVNATFTHAQVVGGLLAYSHDGSQTSMDSFNFTLADGEEDSVTGVSGTFNININDINQPASISSALEDRFDVTNGIDGVIDFNSSGAVAFKINIDDPDGASFGVGDFSLLGNIGGQPISNFFEIIEPQAGEFFLALKSNLQIIDFGSGNSMINDGSTDIHGFSGPINFGIRLDDNGDLTPIENVTIAVQNLTEITGTGEQIVYSNEIFIGNQDDNVFKLIDGNFKFVRGGQGYDVIKLDGANQGSGDITPDIIDLTSTVSNLVGNSADLKSIEEFRFVDAVDELKINIQDLKDLLRTSENGEVIFGSGGAPSTTGADDSVNGIFFSNDGGTTFDLLTNHGFSKQADYDDGTENYEVYEYTFGNGDIGTVLIESDIAGATTGGL